PRPARSAGVIFFLALRAGSRPRSRPPSRGGVHVCLDVVQELLGLLVGQVERLAAEQVDDERLVLLLDLHRADVVIAEQQLHFGGGVFQQGKAHGCLLGLWCGGASPWSRAWTGG